MRADELTNVRIEDLKQRDDVYLVKIPKTKTYLPRSFTVEGDYAKIIKTYIALRPKHTDSPRFFVKFSNGKCANQVMGRNKFLGAPKKIAEYLGLENPEEYTGHSLRRTAATFAAEGGAPLLGVKQLGGWQSDKIAQHYIENTLHNKRQIASYITKRIESGSSSTIVESKSDTVQNASTNLVEMHLATTENNSEITQHATSSFTSASAISSASATSSASAIREISSSMNAISSVSANNKFANTFINPRDVSKDVDDAGRLVMNFKDCDVTINYK